MAHLEREISRSIAVNGRLRLDLRIPNGRLVVQGSDRPDVFVRAKLEGWLDSPEAAAGLIEQALNSIVYEDERLIFHAPSLGNMRSPQSPRTPPTMPWFEDLRRHGIPTPPQPPGARPLQDVGRRWPFGNSLKVDYYIETPRHAEAEIEVLNGTLELRAIAGPLTATCPNGNLRLDPLRREVTVCTVEDVAQAVTLDVRNSRTRIRHCGGAVEATVANGPLTLVQIAGNVKLSSANGPVEIEDVGGAVEAKGANGPIKYRGDLHGNFEMRTTNGPIHLELPANARFELDAEAAHGGVYSGFTLREQASSSTPRPLLKLRTLNGSIRVEEMAPLPV